MSCLEMTAVGPDLQTPDATKHVYYNLGMVLGVDDFNQDFAYHAEARRWMARDAIGYGTLNGLHVSAGVDAKGPFVRVCPGTALTPRGQMVRVTPAQCAYLNPWLGSNGQTLLDLGLRPPKATLRLYVVLCYRECPTDTVQIPGEPCKSESATRVPSRLKDDFRLEIRTKAPDQTEEDAIRAFVDWLRAVKPTDDVAHALTREQFAELVRTEAASALPCGGAAGSHVASPPDELPVPERELCDYLDIAFRIWTTELRPKCHREPPPGGVGCEPPPQDPKAMEECLLLAELVVPIQQAGSNWEVAPASPPDAQDSNIDIDESRRPIVVSTRMLQEMLLCGPCCGDRKDMLEGDVAGPLEANSIKQIQSVAVDAGSAADGQYLRMAGGKWRAVDPPPPPTLDGDVETDPDLAHTNIVALQGKILNAPSPQVNDVLAFVKPPRGLRNEWRPVTLKGDVVISATGATRIDRLNAKPGQVLTFGKDGSEDKWVAADASGGAVLLTEDVISQADGKTRIAKLQGQTVDAASPAPGDVLGFDKAKGAWIPKPGIIAGGAFYFAPGARRPDPPVSKAPFGGFTVLGYNSPQGPFIYLLTTFDGYDPARAGHYVVAGAHWNVDSAPGAFLELVDTRKATDSLKAILSNMVSVDDNSQVQAREGMLLRLTYPNNEPSRKSFGFTVQISVV